MKNAIETKNLTKIYSNNFKAVNSLSLEIPDKTIFGMLGPNGAGKTTTIKMLTCLIQPTSGQAIVGGIGAQRQQCHHHCHCNEMFHCLSKFYLWGQR